MSNKREDYLNKLASKTGARIWRVNAGDNKPSPDVTGFINGRLVDFIVADEAPLRDYQREAIDKMRNGDPVAGNLTPIHRTRQFTMGHDIIHRKDLVTSQIPEDEYKEILDVLNRATAKNMHCALLGEPLVNISAPECSFTDKDYIETAKAIEDNLSAITHAEIVKKFKAISGNFGTSVTPKFRDPFTDLLPSAKQAANAFRAFGMAYQMFGRVCRPRNYTWRMTRGKQPRKIKVWHKHRPSHVDIMNLTKEPIS